MKKLFSLFVATFVAISLMASDDVYSVDFTQGKGNWTINNVSLGGMNSPVWTESTSYGMKASAYVNYTNYAVESWLISPEIDMTNALSPVLNFYQAMKFGDASQLSVRARINGGEWVTLSVSQWPSGNDWTFITSTANMYEFAGCSNVQIAFVYTSSTARAGTWEIKSVEITSYIHKIGDLGYMFDDDNNTAKVSKCGNKNIKDVIIPPTVDYDGKSYRVTGIGYYAFEGCYSVRTVVIGNNVSSIDHYAFRDCDSLISLTISNSVVDAGGYIFPQLAYHEVTIYFNGSLADWCRRPWTTCGRKVLLYINGNKIEDVEIPSEITHINGYCFSGCKSLKSVNIPSSVTSIGEGAFDGCSGLTSVTIPNSVTDIEDFAFRECTGLISVTLSNSVTSIGSDVFQDCYSLKSPVYNEHVFAYLPHSIETYSIPEGIEYINSDAFARCDKLTSVTVPNSVTSIGKEAFWDCTGLLSLTIPNSVINIGEDAFYNVLNVIYSGTSSGAPWGAKSLNGYVEDYFVYKDNTKTQLLACSLGAPSEITIPNSVISIGERAFANCSNLTSITIHSRVTSIGDQAFSECYHLTSVALPNSITNIGQGLFSFCYDLTSIKIPNSVTSIGHHAFYACQSLTSIEIPNSVTNIGDQAFAWCRNLTSVTIGENVQNIESLALFDYCASLKTVTCYSMRPPSVMDEYYTAFRSLDCSSIILYVPADYLDDYQAHEVWGLFDVRPLGAESTETAEVIVTPSKTAVEVIWPSVEGAASYELVIKDKSGNVICTLIFNANGQLTSIAFNAPSRDHAPQQPQTSGFSFTVTGLEEGESYDLIITSKDNSGSTLDERVISFTTGGEQALEDVNAITTSHKIIRNGQILILRGDRTYTVTGQEIK
jgi:hypothetical protein